MTKDPAFEKGERDGYAGIYRPESEDKLAEYSEGYTLSQKIVLQQRYEMECRFSDFNIRPSAGNWTALEISMELYQSIRESGRREV